MAIAGFVIYLLVPVAPPRFAYQFGEALPVHDIMGNTWEKLDAVAWVSWAYANMSGNPYAAFPSLHAAFPCWRGFSSGAATRSRPGSWSSTGRSCGSRSSTWGTTTSWTSSAECLLAAGHLLLVVSLGMLDRLFRRLAPAVHRCPTPRPAESRYRKQSTASEPFGAEARAAATGSESQALRASSVDGYGGARPGGLIPTDPKRRRSSPSSASGL